MLLLVFFVLSFYFFFFIDPATTEIYTLSLHDALPICIVAGDPDKEPRIGRGELDRASPRPHILVVIVDAEIEVPAEPARSEEHTSELQSRQYLVCRLLLEKKKKQKKRRQQ